MIHKRDIEEAARRLPHPERYRGHGDVMRTTGFRVAQFRLKKGYCWRTGRDVYWWDFEGIEC
jgi:hypothetical protein